MSSCGDDPQPGLHEFSTQQGNSEAELSQEARSLALEAMQWFGESRSRSNGFVIDEASTESFITNDSRSSECDTLFQIINFQDSAGYAIVGDIGGRKQLLAAVNGGHLSLSDTDLPVQDAILLESTRRYVVTRPRDSIGIGGTGTEVMYQTKTVIDTLSKECVEPLIGLHWGQTLYSGELCYNFTAGCFPVAVGQMMAYFKPGGKFYYTYPNAEIPFEYINWEEINMHKGWGIFETMCPESVHATLPRIMREIGHRANADYYSRPLETSVKPKDFRTTISSVLPNCTNSVITDFSVSAVKNILKNRGIALVLGTLQTSANDTVAEGHVWLAEGYRFYNLKYQMLRKPKDLHSAWGYEEPWEVIEEKIYNECYIYYNMGFDGKGDRFVLSDLDLQIMNNHGYYDGGPYHNNYSGPFHYFGYNLQYISVNKK